MNFMEKQRTIVYTHTCCQMRQKSTRPYSIAIMALMLVLTLLSCNTDTSSFETDISVPVSISEVKTRSIEQYVNTTGSVYAMQEVTIVSEIVGDYYLLKNAKTGKPYVLGDKAESGQKIIRLENV